MRYRPTTPIGRTERPWLSARSIAFVLAVILLVSPWLSLADESEPAAGAPAQEGASAQEESALVVGVFYATNRGRDAKAPAAVAYNGERGEPSQGRCRVEFSPIPLVKDLGSIAPFYLPRETHQKTVVEEPNSGAFWGDLVAAASQTASGSLVVFVHGYNYGFKRTCRMAAELQRTLRGKATVLMISWPSNGLPTDYLPDQADVEWSVPFLASLLAELAERIGPARTKVLAHSMGTRGVLFALQRLAGDLERRPVIGQLVLLAPDFDSATFVELLPRLVPLAGGITLYASSNDTALVASRQLYGHPRLGEAGEYLTVAEGIETIDVSPGGRYQILGHEYFYYHPSVVADLAELLGSGTSAAERTALRQRERNGIAYWEIAEEGPPQ